jgi:hypothetical protein
VLPEFNAENNDFAMSIVEKTKDYDLSKYDFVQLREKAFDEKLKKRLEAANRVHQENKEDSGDSSESSSDDEISSIAMKTLVCNMNKLKIE